MKAVDIHWAGKGGHSENRILHHKDVTGKEIERALLKRAEETFKH